MYIYTVLLAHKTYKSFNCHLNLTEIKYYFHFRLQYYHSAQDMRKKVDPPQPSILLWLQYSLENYMGSQKNCNRLSSRKKKYSIFSALATVFVHTMVHGMKKYLMSTQPYSIYTYYGAWDEEISNKHSTLQYLYILWCMG